MPQSSKPCGHLVCQIVGWHTAPCEVPNDPPAEKAPAAVRLKRPEYLLDALRRALRLIDGWESISVSEHLSELESLRAIADPPTELQLDRRELASIRAGLQLLQKFERQTSRNFSLCRMVDAISSENDTLEPLTAAEIDDLVRRLA